MKKKIFVIDTNVLITDPLAFLSYSKDDSVVIPYKVIEELEKHKLSDNAVGIAARQCSRELNFILSSSESTLNKGITLENGSLLRVLSAREILSKDKMQSTIGELVNGDDYILGVAIALKDLELKKEVVVVSNDMLLRIRANSFGIKVQEHDNDGEAKTISEIYSGYRKIDFDEETLSRYWKCHSEKEELEFNIDHLLGGKKLLPNEFVTYSGPERKPYVLLRQKPGMDHPVVIKERALDKINALNVEQAMVTDLLMDPDISLVTLVGSAGTGKTLLAIEAGLKQVLSDKRYEKLLVLRPVHSVGKEIGFLPGLKEEKLEPWIAPIKDNLKFLLSKDKDKDKEKTYKESTGNKSQKGPQKIINANKKLDYYFEQGIIEIEAMSFIRGRSINNAYIIVEEAQNTNHHEIKTILTRVGYGTKVVMTGDIEQSDRNDVSALNNGMAIAINKFKNHDIAAHVTLIKGVRSKLSALAAKIL